MTTLLCERYLVVADQGHKDVVLGSYRDFDSALETVEAYNSSTSDPFCWIEMSVHPE